jgi:hypothetical protein
LQTGEKLLVVSRDGEILLRKTKKLSIDNLAQKLEVQALKQNIDVNKIIDETVEWARRSK